MNLKNYLIYYIKLRINKLHKNRELELEVYKWIITEKSISDNEIVRRLDQRNFKISAPSIATWKRHWLPEIEKEFKFESSELTVDKFVHLNQLKENLKIINERILVLKQIIDSKKTTTSEGKEINFLSIDAESNLRDYIKESNNLHKTIINLSPDINVSGVIQDVLSHTIKVVLLCFRDEEDKKKWPKLKQDLIDLEMTLKEKYSIK